jgi:hypothetical protein
MKLYPIQSGQLHTPKTAFGTVTVFPNGIIMDNNSESFLAMLATINVMSRLASELLRVPADCIITENKNVRDIRAYYDAAMVFTTEFHAECWCALLKDFEGEA